jgi:MFS family permease
LDKLRKDVIVFYLYSFFIGLYIANGTTVLFERVLGFSFSRIFILGAVYMLMFVIFEIPSGAFADLIGRKATVMIGCGALALGAVATGLSHTFTQVFFSFFLWSFGFSMISGADEAMLYDRLQDEKTYAQVVGRSHFFALSGMALAGVVGPYLYSLNFRSAYLASAIPFFLAGSALLFFQENRGRQGQFTLTAHWAQIKTGVLIAYQNRFVLWAIAVLSMVFGVAYTLSNSYQPYLQNLGFSIHAFSVILPVMFVIQALGGMVSGKIYVWLGENKIFAFCLTALGILVGLLGILTTKQGLAILFGYAFLQGILQPVLSTYTNRYIDSTHRATVISVQSMIATIAAALTLFLFGFLTDQLGLSRLFLILGVLVLIVSFVTLIAKPREQTI